MVTVYLTYSFRNMWIKRKASVYLSVCECYYEIKIKEWPVNLLKHDLQGPTWSVLPPLPFSLEKAMVPHSSTLAWKIPWMEEPGRLQSMGSLRVGHDWVTSLSLSVIFHFLFTVLQPGDLCAFLEHIRHSSTSGHLCVLFFYL